MTGQPLAIPKSAWTAGPGAGSIRAVATGDEEKFQLAVDRMWKGIVVMALFVVPVIVLAALGAEGVAFGYLVLAVLVLGGVVLSRRLRDTRGR